jgi:hypothetical protein
MRDSAPTRGSLTSSKPLVHVRVRCKARKEDVEEVETTRDRLETAKSIMNRAKVDRLEMLRGLRGVIGWFDRAKSGYATVKRKKLLQSKRVERGGAERGSGRVEGKTLRRYRQDKLVHRKILFMIHLESPKTS